MLPRTLVTRFSEAHLPLECPTRPLMRGGGDIASIVQFDIAKTPRERFRLWRGAHTNEVEVVATSASLRQVVVSVLEPRRVFHTYVLKSMPRTRGERVIRTDSTGRWVEHSTPESERHYLAGVDESHLFIAPLPRGVTSVWAAHHALKGDAVRVAERSALEPTIRQGEWFFVSLLPRQRARLDWALARDPKAIVRGRGIAEVARVAREGQQHVATEVCVVKGRIYVRGQVSHSEHRTVEFETWRRAVLNAERQAPSRGLLWVD